MDVAELIIRQKEYYNSGKTRSLETRLHHLRVLYEGIQRHEADILGALQADLNKSEVEAYMTEIGYALKEISFLMKRLPSLMKPQKVNTPITHAGSKGKIIPEPYGVTLIIAPWNYPFQLAIAPLVGAIAAGNTAVMKPSELTPNVSKVLARIMDELFHSDYIAVVEGGVNMSTELLKQPFDYIFFTGSVAVGKVVMEAAAKQLIPVTLELGGKSPCIVHEDARLDVTARRIAWGKFINAGQTCVAPDYVYVQQNVKEQLLRELQKAIQEQFGVRPLENQEFVRIVSERHFQRLASFLQDGTVVVGGETDASRLMIEPTVLDHISWDDAVMQEEIFGPILPVLTYADVEDVVRTVNAHPKPLALYVFTESEQVQQKIVECISYGGGCVNDTMYHLASPYLPFGGVGESGTGSYHGEQSFRAFSHYKSVLYQSTKWDFKLRYSSSKRALKYIRKLLK
ncbi:aldehyde dehydrogenase [Ectobacillus funiculus]|uniref:Aldehyde dehydrogenase n=1 Tax=Ectobacillus funiculus TaxID=137993 RepID=A0ABV5WPC6_9BACI